MRYRRARRMPRSPKLRLSRGEHEQLPVHEWHVSGNVADELEHAGVSGDIVGAYDRLRRERNRETGKDEGVRVVFRIYQREMDRVTLNDGQRALRKGIHLFSLEYASSAEIPREQWVPGPQLLRQQRNGGNGAIPRPWLRSVSRTPPGVLRRRGQRHD